MAKKVKNTMSKKVRIVIFVGVLLGLFLILNFNYFVANLKLIYNRPQITYIAEHSQIQATMTPDTLIIQSLGITAPVVYATEKTEKAYQAALINGVVHYPDTANPGQLGNVYIFGHSSDFIWSKGHYKTIFATLPQITKGAEIDISDSGGQKFVYLVTGTFVVSPDDASVLDQHNNTEKLLTLQTSWPVGTALKRWIVTAEIKNSPN